MFKKESGPRPAHSDLTKPNMASVPLGMFKEECGLPPHSIPTKQKTTRVPSAHSIHTKQNTTSIPLGEVQKGGGLPPALSNLAKQNATSVPLGAV